VEPKKWRERHDILFYSASCRTCPPPLRIFRFVPAPPSISMNIMTARFARSLLLARLRLAWPHCHTKTCSSRYLFSNVRLAVGLFILLNRDGNRTSLNRPSYNARAVESFPLILKPQSPLRLLPKRRRYIKLGEQKKEAEGERAEWRKTTRGQKTKRAKR